MTRSRTSRSGWSRRRSRSAARTGRIIEHRLLLEHSPAKEPRRGWIDEIVDFRDEIERRLTLLYAEARRNLQRKLKRHGEADVVARLPERCPFTLDQMLATTGRPRPDHRRFAAHSGKRTWGDPAGILESSEGSCARGGAGL
jgi:Domain of unknown function DUF29